VSVIYDNLGGKRVDVYPYGDTLLIRGADGAEYDTFKGSSWAISAGPIAKPIVVQPGSRYSSDPSELPVRWEGPLTITPRCQGNELPPLTIAVADPGPTPSAQDALSRSAQATQIFRECMPNQDGSSVVGTISPPDGAGFDPITTRCWAQIQRYEGFATVTFAFVSPLSAPAEPLTQYWFDLRIPEGAVPAEVSQWTFVVTADRVLSVDGPAGKATERGGTPPLLTDVDYIYEQGTWHHGDPGSTCGGGDTEGPGLYFFIVAAHSC
jgi:hypothetical protein